MATKVICLRTGSVTCPGFLLIQSRKSSWLNLVVGLVLYMLASSSFSFVNPSHYQFSQWEDVYSGGAPFFTPYTDCILYPEFGGTGAQVDCIMTRSGSDYWIDVSFLNANYIKVQNSGGVVCIGTYGTGSHQCWSLNNNNPTHQIIFTSLPGKVDTDGDVWMDNWDPTPNSPDFDRDGVPDAQDFAPQDANVFCATGSYWNGSVCTAASAGYYVPNQHSTSQTACAAGTYQPLTGQTSCNTDTTCTLGVTYETVAPTTTTDRVCSAVSACSAGQYESSAPTLVSDRACATVTDCSALSEYTQTPATATSDAVCGVYMASNCATYSSSSDACTACTSGYNLVGSVCLLQQTITVTTPSPITARVNSSFAVAATASSGLPVSITTADGCTGGGTNSGTITMTGTSSDCTITYDQPGDGTNYDAAPELAFLTSLPKTVRGDLDGDGKADVLFINTTTGGTKYWSGAAKAQSIYVGTYNHDYTYAGNGDFDGDGKADLLFIRTSDNMGLIWNGAVKTSTSYPGAGATGYSVAAVCDTDGNGKDDIVWYNQTTGSVRIWPDASKAGVTYPGIQNTAYAIAACADFDGDGHADIFWRNAATGADQVWLGGHKSSMMYPGANTDLTVIVVGAGDTDGDGQADLVWYTPSTNSIRIWLGGLKAASTYLGTGATGFTPKAIADYDGDGMADLLWANDTTLATQIWPAFIKANVTYPGAYPTGFVIQK
jgi:hypothetical protein